MIVDRTEGVAAIGPLGFILDVGIIEEGDAGQLLAEPGEKLVAEHAVRDNDAAATPRAREVHDQAG